MTDDSARTALGRFDMLSDFERSDSRNPVVRGVVRRASPSTTFFLLLQIPVAPHDLRIISMLIVCHFDVCTYEWHE